MYRCFILFKSICLILVCLTFTACATSPKTTSELQRGKRYFDEGYYKQAMRYLLPAACDGDAKAQYAVGYMYYYGYGVAQDDIVGYFWIHRSSIQHYQPAVSAEAMIHTNNAPFA